VKSEEYYIGTGGQQDEACALALHISHARPSVPSTSSTVSSPSLVASSPRCAPAPPHTGAHRVPKHARRAGARSPHRSRALEIARSAGACDTARVWIEIEWRTAVESGMTLFDQGRGKERSMVSFSIFLLVIFLKLLNWIWSNCV
jgi:hypothetical protein